MDKNQSSSLPRVTCYVSEDPIEFDLLVDFYKNQIQKEGSQYQINIYVSEQGDFEKFVTDVVTVDLFVPKKFIIIKSGKDLFKPISSSGKADKVYNNFESAMKKIPDNIYILIHYNSWDISSKVTKSFGDQIVSIKPKTLYKTDQRQALNQVIKREEIHFSEEGISEFLYVSQPSIGAYLKNVKKLKLFYPKKTIGKEEIMNVLYDKNEFNSANLIEKFLDGSQSDFFRESLKLDSDPKYLLIFCTQLLTKIDEIRKYKILLKRYANNLPEDVLFPKLGWESYSDGRKYHQKKNLVQHSRKWKDKYLLEAYQFLIDLNSKIKTSSSKDEIQFFFQTGMNQLFDAIHKSN
jgi:DNA polymerase-3 subunit delta